MELLEGYIVCSNDIKDKILEEEKNKVGFKDYKFLTEDSFIKGFYDSFKDESLSYLVSVKKIDASVAKLYLSFLYIISIDEDYNSDKLNFLKELKKELINNNFVQQDLLYIDMIKKNHISFIDVKNKKLINFLIDKYKLNASFINTSKHEKKELNVHYFKDSEEELIYVFNEIKKLVKQNVSLNDIKIVNCSDDYNFLLNRLSNSLDIKINFKPQSNPISKKIYQKFLTNLTTMSLEDNINDLSNLYNLADVNQLIDIINKYRTQNYPQDSLISLYEYLIKNFKYTSNRYDNALDLISVSDISSNLDKYLFLINFDSSIPNIKKDDDYLTDEEKKTLMLLQSKEENEYIKLKTINNLYLADKLTITYSTHHAFQKMIECPLVIDLEMNVIKENSREFGVDKISDDLYLSKSLDNYVKFNMISEDLNKYYYSDLNYNSYDNSYEKIDEDIFKSIRGSNYKLSYSKMDTYFHCPFEYYCQQILKVDEFEDTLPKRLGTYAHGILEKYENSNKDENFNFSSAKEEMIKDIYQNKELTLSDKYYLDKTDDYIKEIMIYNDNHENDSRFKKVITEENIEVSLHDGHVIFTGYVDKQLTFEENGVDYVAVIDYKTYTKTNSISNLSDGFNLQLPIYLYLISNKLKNPHYLGIYLQKLEFKPGKVDEEKGDYSLQGYSSYSFDDLEKIYSNWQDDSKYLGVKVTKNNTFDSRCVNKLLDQEEFKMLIDIAKKKIEDMINAIDSREFEILPKTIEIVGKTDKDEDDEIDIKTSTKQFMPNHSLITSKYEPLPCSYCKMRDICYKKNSDIYIYEKKDYVNNATKDLEYLKEKKAEEKEIKKLENEDLKNIKEFKKGMK